MQFLKFKGRFFHCRLQRHSQKPPFFLFLLSCSLGWLCLCLPQENPTHMKTMWNTLTFHTNCWSSAFTCGLDEGRFEKNGRHAFPRIPQCEEVVHVGHAGMGGCAFGFSARLWKGAGYKNSTRTRTFLGIAGIWLRNHLRCIWLFFLWHQRLNYFRKATTLVSKFES